MTFVHPIRLFALALLVTIALAGLGRANQLVTADQAQWAQAAVAQEKQLSAATRPNSIAVLYFQNMSKDLTLDPLQKGLAVMLISDLSKLDMVTVIERAELQALVEELGFGQSGLVAPESAPRVGRLLQAQYLIGGTLSGNATASLAADARVVDVAPGKPIGQADASAAMERLFVLEQELLDQIVQVLKLDLTERQKQAIHTPLSRNPEALMALFKGIDAADRKAYDDAEQLFEQALAKDPELTLARTSLEELDAVKKEGAQVGPAGDKAKVEDELARRRRMLHLMRNRTSLTTTLQPATPLSRIPSRVAIQPPVQEEPPVEQPVEEPVDQPVDQPVDTTPVDTTPVDTTPVDTTPVDTTPVDTTPVADLPADGSLVDTTTPTANDALPQ